MTWRYQVIRDKHGNHNIHEVFELDEGRILWTATPVKPTGECQLEVLEELARMMLDCARFPVTTERALKLRNARLKKRRSHARSRRP